MTYFAVTHFNRRGLSVNRYRCNRKKDGSRDDNGGDERLVGFCCQVCDALHFFISL